MRHGYWLGFVLALAAISDAHADWEYTTWGMSPEQVVAASAGKARLCACDDNGTSDLDAKATARHLAANFAFTVYFQFDRRTNGLTRVSLVLDETTKCPALRDSLAVLYGKPFVESTTPRLDMSSWRSQGNSYVLTNVKLGSGKCELSSVRTMTR